MKLLLNIKGRKPNAEVSVFVIAQTKQLEGVGTTKIGCFNLYCYHSERPQRSHLELLATVQQSQASIDQ